MRTLLLAAALALSACAVRSPTLLPPQPPRVTADLRYVSCMVEPPQLEVIDWPDADKLGNVLLHRSTVERIQGAYAALRRYALEQYFRCLHVAEAKGEQTVTVETEP